MSKLGELLEAVAKLLVTSIDNLESLPKPEEMPVLKRVTPSEHIRYIGGGISQKRYRLRNG